MNKNNFWEKCFFLHLPWDLLTDVLLSLLIVSVLSRTYDTNTNRDAETIGRNGFESRWTHIFQSTIHQ